MRQGKLTPVRRHARWLAFALLPLALILRALAFRMPLAVEQWYSQGIYPWVVRATGLLAATVPFSVAEATVTVGVLALSWAGWRRRAALRGRSALGLLGAGLAWCWVVAGVVVLLFQLAWGLNYARPPLSVRLQLPSDPPEPLQVLDLARRTAALTTRLHAQLNQSPDAATELPLTFVGLDRAVGRAYASLRLPGDLRARDDAPAKVLWISPLLSRLGISGVFVPFTGEPSINGEVPDVSLPLVVAHERAHRRGITDEGEANLAAVMACLHADDAYVRYAAHLEVAIRLLGVVGRELPDEAVDVSALLGAGPRADLAAIREFWERHRGAASRVAGRVNDAYLRSNRVPGGVRSYGRVVDMLLGLDRLGQLELEPAIP